MGKLEEINAARINAMEYATRRIEDIGIDKWKQELRFRGANGLSVPISKKDFIREYENLQKTIIKQCLLMAVITLIDEFEFTEAQVKDFVRRYNLKADCMGDDYHLWQDYADMVKSEYDIDLGIKINK